MRAPIPSIRPRFGLRTAPSGLAPLGLVLALAGLAAPAQAQGRPDQVLMRNARGQSRTVSGTVVENTLSKVVIENDGDKKNFDADKVDRVVFGDVPPAFVDGVAYFDRGDFENAAAKFGVAAGDAAARDVVKAAARLRSARAWMRRGVSDVSAFQQAKQEVERFLADYAENRDVPEARALLGRASWLAGDAAGAGDIYRALYQEAQGEEPTAGYSYPVCFAAGLASAEAFLASGDIATAREMYNGLSGAVTSVLASLEADSPERRPLTNLQIQARLGEGFCLLADGAASQAKTFFQGMLNDAGAESAQRFGAQLGLAETLLAEGDARRAQIEFAQVSALDHTSRDRAARALVGLAECSVRLPDTGGRQRAKDWLQTVREQYGDTPSVLRAQELSQTL